MKKILQLTSMLMLAITGNSLAQNTATDFTVNNCSNNSVHLFGELDAGKVIVMAWVMPCGSCTGPAKTAYNIVQSYKTSNPGKVVYYLIDDAGNTNCTSLTSWGSNNGITAPDGVFSNSAISMNDYGSAGMPKVVVLGGTNHAIYFNQNNSAAGNSTAIQGAITNALAAGSTGIDNNKNSEFKFTVFPNPATDNVLVSYTLTKPCKVNLEITNTLGEQIKLLTSEHQSSGKYETQVNTDALSNGIYFFKIYTEAATQQYKVSISK